MSKYPGLSEKPIVHPKVGLSVDSVKEEAEQFLKKELSQFIETRHKRFTKVKFSVIFTPTEFCIAAYRNEGSKGFFSKCKIVSHKKSKNEVAILCNYRCIDEMEIRVRLSLLDSMIIVFSLFGGQLHFDFKDILDR
jgi:hypothetical protein